MKDRLSALNQPLTPKRAIAAICMLAVLVGVCFVGRALWQWRARTPKSTASVKSSIQGYLKEHSHDKDFASQYDFELRAKVAAMQTNLAALRDECSALRTNQAAAQNRVLAARRALNAATEQERVARVAIGPAKTNAPAPSDKQALLEQRQKELAAAKEALAARQEEAKALMAKATEREAALAALRREFNGKSQELVSQGMSFSREIRKSVDEAPSYESIYAAIGRCLWTADKLLASGEAGDQRQGAMLGLDATAHASRAAENYWLAARIAEAYIWPNLDRFDLPGKKVAAYQALQVSGEAFNRAGETNNVARNYERILAYAATPRAADAARYYLGSVLEQLGNFTGALDNYRAIQDSNYIRYATQRIAIVEQRYAKKVQ